jgi:hypothetical protein
MREFAEHLHEIGALRPDLGVEEAAQRIWAVHGPVLYRQLAVELRWPRQQVVDFVAELLVAALLPQKAVPRRR